MASSTRLAQAASSLPDAGVIVATKLYIPSPAPARIPRRELVDGLILAPEARLALIAAPAGSGKTTLLSQWHADPKERRPFAWLSLDVEDNDPVRFWHCVAAALDTVVPGMENALVPLLRAPQANLTELVLPVLINRLADAREHLVLVLDDYHMIVNEEVHQSLAYFLEHVPAHIQLVIASRTDPPLHLPRLRARGGLHEVRAADLRLDTHQANALLNESLGPDLEPAYVGRLQDRTEGWAAGLQLVGLSLRGRADAREYIQSFSGDDRHIVDYIGS